MQMRPTPSEVEAEVLTTIRAHMQAWARQGAAAIEGFLTYIAEDFTGFGTGPGDYVRNRDGLRALTQHEQQYLAYPFILGEDWLKVRVLHPALALAEGEYMMDVHTEAETLALVIRCSILLAYRNDRWLVIHAHYSLPDAMQNVGGTLMDALKARNRELEREVARRTAELKQSLDDLKATQARLVQQEKMASLGQLTAGIAHEIKNPLNFVNNFAELSVDLADDLAQSLAGGEDVSELLEDLKSNAAAISHHGRRADSIVRSMMQHASGRRGERESVDLNVLLDEYVNLAYHGRKAHQVGFICRIERAYDKTLGRVELVPPEMGRVFLNLLSNAFDAVHGHALTFNATDGRVAARPYTPTVRVRTQRLEDQVELRIEDNGPGIDKAVREKIFEPFFTTKPTGSGIGLGLSLAYDIVTQGHGGSLAVESTEGGGATFIVTLPAYRAQPDEA